MPLQIGGAGPQGRPPYGRDMRRVLNDEMRHYAKICGKSIPGKESGLLQESCMGFLIDVSRWALWNTNEPFRFWGIFIWSKAGLMGRWAYDPLVRRRWGTQRKSSPKMSPVRWGFFSFIIPMCIFYVYMYLFIYMLKAFTTEQRNTSLEKCSTSITLKLYITLCC